MAPGSRGKWTSNLCAHAWSLEELTRTQQRVRPYNLRVQRKHFAARRRALCCKIFTYLRVLTNESSIFCLFLTLSALEGTREMKVGACGVCRRGCFLRHRTCVRAQQLDAEVYCSLARSWCWSTTLRGLMSEQFCAHAGKYFMVADSSQCLLT